MFVVVVVLPAEIAPARLSRQQQRASVHRELHLNTTDPLIATSFLDSGFWILGPAHWTCFIVLFAGLGANKLKKW
jgi:hypothetical protein